MHEKMPQYRQKIKKRRVTQKTFVKVPEEEVQNLTNMYIKKIDELLVVKKLKSRKV
jgi:ribosome recycling factor